MVQQGWRWLRQVETVSDWLSLSRLVLAPLIWIPALRRQPRGVAAGVALSAATDVLDGAFARLSGHRSAFGSQLDTVADMAIILSSPGWIALLYPQTLRRRAAPVVMLLAVAGGALSLEWRRFHRLGNLHIHSTRAAAVAAHLYVIDLFVRQRDSEVLFDAFLLLAAGGAFESLYVILTFDSLDDLTETPILSAMLAGSPVSRS